MTYEEKLQKIISKFREERKLSRNGRKTRVIFDDKTFTKVRIGDICKILLKLWEDEKIVSLVTAFQKSQTKTGKFEIVVEDEDDFENVVEIIVEVDEKFDNWYEKYLLKQKSRPQNLNSLNFLKLLNVCEDIDNQLQITNDTRIAIPNEEFRWQIIKYLEKEAVVSQIQYEYVEELGYNHINMNVNVAGFEDFYEQMKRESERRNNEPNKGTQSINESKATTHPILRANKKEWPRDYKWEGNEYIFGKKGKIAFTSSDRKRIFKTLTDKEGGWATVIELRGNKDDGYVRTTIKQIEKRLPKEMSEVLEIQSTLHEDADNKPSSGAYRIKLIHT